MVSTVRSFEFNIPHQNDLCCMVCNIVNPGNDPMTKYPEYWRNKLKYRKFLDEIPEAIAAPKENFKDGIIYVIVPKDLFKNATFLHDFNALDIQIMEQDHPISDSIYENCLLNTMEHKLLGQWNKVGKYLVKGPDFLNLMETVNAIELNIYIRDNKAHLYMQAFDLQIPFLRLEGRDFEPGEEVYVLPKLTPANVICRHESIQEDHPDVREYWRKVHGYTLPVNEKGLLFYEVKFFEKWFKVYNELCLTSSQNLTFSPLKNDAENRIYENFVEDLRERVTTLCGQELVYPKVQECITHSKTMDRIVTNFMLYSLLKELKKNF